MKEEIGCENLEMTSNRIVYITLLAGAPALVYWPFDPFHKMSICGLGEGTGIFCGCLQSLFLFSL